MMPCAITLATAAPADSMSPKLAMMQRASCGFGNEFHRDFGDDGQHAFTAHHHGQQIEARRVQRLRTELHRLAVRHEAANPQHVVQRQTVLEAVHAAGIFGHVAADAARDLAARVRCIVQTERRRRLADGEIAHPALHDGGAGVGIDRQDLIELGERKNDAPRVRRGAAGQSGSRPARNDRYTQAVADLERRRHLCFRFGKHHGHRRGTVGGERVALVGCGVFMTKQKGTAGQNLAERSHHLRLAPFARWELHIGRVRRIHVAHHPQAPLCISRGPCLPMGASLSTFRHV